MTRNPRPRQLATSALSLVLLAALGACSGPYPNSTFTNLTEYNRDLTHLWWVLMWWGTAVFVVVEGILVWAMFKYRHRPGGAPPEHVHGNTVLELTWTLAPAVILVFIAIPTVRTIWKYQSPAPAGALQIDVIGHQWWWEFRYPQYGFTTANELYLPMGRTVNFALTSKDVIHSFWIPQLGGKRDAVTNRTNYIWFTPDSGGPQAFNGSCNEYCGTSHANMRFRAFTVTAADFDRWVANQQQPAVFGAVAAAPPAASTTPVPAPAGASVSQMTPLTAPPAPVAESFSFPRDQIPAHVMPRTPVPRGLTFADDVLAAGDAQRGLQIYSRSACVGCHRVRGNRASIGDIGPELTHFGSRHTLGAGIYPNDAKHLALWIKNARRMKPMSATSMPTIGIGEFDPYFKLSVTTARGGLTDQQIADIVAYLLSLK